MFATAAVDHDVLVLAELDALGDETVGERAALDDGAMRGVTRAALVHRPEHRRRRGGVGPSSLHVVTSKRPPTPIGSDLSSSGTRLTLRVR